MRSKIYLDEKVDNKDRRFGQALEYYPVEVISGGRCRFALLTPGQVGEALVRGEANEEDKPAPTRWERLRAWLRGLKVQR